RDDLPLAHEARRRDDVLGRRMVERADLVGGTPASPVLVFLRGFGEILAGELACGHLASPLRAGPVIAHVSSQRNDQRRERRKPSHHQRTMSNPQEALRGGGNPAPCWISIRGRAPS